MTKIIIANPEAGTIAETTLSPRDVLYLMRLGVEHESWIRAQFGEDAEDIKALIDKLDANFETIDTLEGGT